MGAAALRSSGRAPGRARRRLRRHSPAKQGTMRALDRSQVPWFPLPFPLDHRRPGASGSTCSAPAASRSALPPGGMGAASSPPAGKVIPGEPGAMQAHAPEIRHTRRRDPDITPYIRHEAGRLNRDNVSAGRQAPDFKPSGGPSGVGTGGAKLTHNRAVTVTDNDPRRDWLPGRVRHAPHQGPRRCHRR